MKREEDYSEIRLLERVNSFAWSTDEGSCIICDYSLFMRAFRSMRELYATQAERDDKEV